MTVQVKAWESCDHQDHHSTQSSQALMWERPHKVEHTPLRVEPYTSFYSGSVGLAFRYHTGRFLDSEPFTWMVTSMCHFSTGVS